jgi:hypothetical protein
VIVNQFNLKSVFSFKTENDPPVCPYCHRPETAKLALERMQAIPGEVERLRRRSLIEAAQNVFHVLQQIRPYPASVVAFKEPFEARCLKLLIIRTHCKAILADRQLILYNTQMAGAEVGKR